MSELTTFNKKKYPYVDIIIPNYNKGRFLEESIASVIKQTYKNWNLFIIDDKSNDNSKEIINKYEKNNIRSIFLPRNKGVSFCRNFYCFY